MKSYQIDCGTCQADVTACGDCLMSFIASPGYGEPVRFSAEEKDALDVMADVGLLPPLRLASA
ncbi:MAG: hypothetical protein LBV00_02100 [Propionibacteriaceae bacterium]|nr:hypothetical protein [Propionibacteriaceae bacterium]